MTNDAGEPSCQFAPRPPPPRCRLLVSAPQSATPQPDRADEDSRPSRPPSERTSDRLVRRQEPREPSKIRSSPPRPTSGRSDRRCRQRVPQPPPPQPPDHCQQHGRQQQRSGQALDPQQDVSHRRLLRFPTARLQHTARPVLTASHLDETSPNVIDCLNHSRPTTPILFRPPTIYRLPPTADPHVHRPPPPPQHRRHRPHRRRQDHRHRADAVLQRLQPPRGRGRQGHHRHRLRPRGAGTGHHDQRRLRSPSPGRTSRST